MHELGQEPIVNRLWLAAGKAPDQPDVTPPDVIKCARKTRRKPLLELLSVLEEV